MVDPAPDERDGALVGDGNSHRGHAHERVVGLHPREQRAFAGMAGADAADLAGACGAVAAVAADEGEVLAKELGEAALFVRHDVTSEDDWAATVAAAEDAFGRIDVLVNNAGILMFSELTATSLADYERVVRVNQFGTFLGMRAVVPAMDRAGGGSIVNSSSIEGLGGMPFLVAY